MALGILFNFHEEISSQAGIRNARRNNLRYADDTTLRGGSEEELQSFLMKKVKEESGKS